MSNIGNQDFKGITHSGVGLNNVGSYQVSGRPYITGSNALAKNTEDVIEFPSVTKWVKVINYSTGAANPRLELEEIRVHFAPKGTDNTIGGHHYIPLSGSSRGTTAMYGVSEVEMSVKCNKIYISAPDVGYDRNYRVIAELTQIDKGRMFDITGSSQPGVTE